MINMPPTSANSIVGFDIDKFIKGEGATDPQTGAPVQLNQNLEQDTVDISKNNEQQKNGWKTFGKMFVAGVIAVCSIPIIKKAIKAIKK